MPPITHARKIASEASHGHQPGQALAPRAALARIHARRHSAVATTPVVAVRHTMLSGVIDPGYNSASPARTLKQHNAR